MTTLTLTLPDDLAERLAVLPPSEVNAYAVQALADLVEADGADSELNEETIAAIEQGLADMDAGRTFSLEEVRARTDAALDAFASTRLSQKVQV
jgi:predicted transcriptional regulator